MEQTRTSPLADRRTKRQLDHAWLAALLEALDGRLRLRHGVSEYTRSADCIFRIQVIVNGDEVLLSDGTRVRPGDRLIDLHVWNEQIPLFPAKGPTLGWARHMSRAIDASLRELALYLAGRRDLDDVTAIRGNITFGSPEQSDQLVRIAERYGFERIAAPGSRSLRQQMRRLGENALISMMVLARNAAALRSDSLRRDRTLVFLSRSILERRYGSVRNKTDGRKYSESDDAHG
jgi:YkoP domain